MLPDVSPASLPRDTAGDPQRQPPYLSGSQCREQGRWSTPRLRAGTRLSLEVAGPLPTSSPVLLGLGGALVLMLGLPTGNVLGSWSSSGQLCRLGGGASHSWSRCQAPGLEVVGTAPLPPPCPPRSVPR